MNNSLLNRLNVRIRLGHCDAGLHARKHCQVMTASLGQGL